MSQSQVIQGRLFASLKRRLMGVPASSAGSADRAFPIVHPGRARTKAWIAVNQALFQGLDPYAQFDSSTYQPDRQGWNSHHSYLTETVIQVRPQIVVEVGVWKGGSTITMADAMRMTGGEGVVIAIDTFLGSWEHYEQPEHFPSLMLKNGYPHLYYTFLTNIIQSDVQDYVQPLALDSANAAFVLERKGIRPQVVHIDAGHDTQAVLNDLRLWWPLLEPGGTVIVDDYDTTGAVWPSVRDGVDAFLRSTPHEAFEALPYKARWRKRFE